MKPPSSHAAAVNTITLTWSCLSQCNLRRTDVGTNACEMTGCGLPPELVSRFPTTGFASDIFGYLNKNTYSGLAQI